MAACAGRAANCEQAIADRRGYISMPAMVALM